ncbi:MAG TPA: pyridoxamine 5'-phosphate oxidase [Mycobacteriales bacterium]|nr:pyridoxamine 5'-phosphate oxidase [Mycobacteriales bacterium]
MHPDLGSLRRDYVAAGLSEAELAPTWTEQLSRWFHEVEGLDEPNAMVLSTASPAGRPSSRTVLLKAYDERGLVFFTNRLSRKGRELAANPQAALLLPWHELQRQVIVTGAVEELEDEGSDAYFASRPRDAQLGAWASEQSAVLPDRASLEAALAATQSRFADGPVPRPPHWGGYRVVPDEVEFWQGRTARLHDRLRFRRTGSGDWVVDRLAP